MTKKAPLSESKYAVIANLEMLQVSLVQCVGEGMIDQNDGYYNEVLGLLEDARIVTTWDELMEIVTLAKTLEVDVAAWLSFHGRTTISLPWPKGP